ncbi:G2/M phase-specific E3 ubiquitin-protein ligase-like protein, partial [Lates japonicus]
MGVPIPVPTTLLRTKKSGPSLIGAELLREGRQLFKQTAFLQPRPRCIISARSQDRAQDGRDISTSEAHSLSSHTPSMSSGDEVIWCFATEDVCTDAPSIPADTLTMSTCAGGITIDETLTMSSGNTPIKENGYFNAGQIMAMSIAHGGQSPCFLSELMYECLQKGPDNVKVKTEHITDEDTRSQVQSILQAETESQLQDAVAQAASLICLSGHNVPITLQNKEETALKLTHWYVLQRTHAPFE